MVVLPETVDQVSRILRYCHDNTIRVVPRGSGTSLSGGALQKGLQRFRSLPVGQRVLQQEIDLIDTLEDRDRLRR